MFLIKSCPACNKKIRFPIDKGKIHVRCSCGHIFIADPDNPELYNDAKFDILYKRKSRRKKIRKINILKSGIIKKFIIRTINLKYKLQNYKYLPASEQRKIIIAITSTIAIIIIIILIIYLLYPAQKKLPEGKGFVFQFLYYADCNSFFLS